MAQLPDLLSPNCQITDVEQAGSILRIAACTTSTESRCPICAVVSSSIHSYHLRQVKDLPMGEQTVLLRIHTKRFRCRNPDCPRGCAGYLRHLSLIHLPGIYVWSILLDKTGSATGINCVRTSLYIEHARTYRLDCTICHTLCGLISYSLARSLRPSPAAWRARIRRLRSSL